MRKLAALALTVTASATGGYVVAPHTSPGACWLAPAGKYETVRSRVRDGWSVQACVFTRYRHGVLVEQTGMSSVGIIAPPVQPSTLKPAHLTLIFQHKRH